MLSQVNSPLCSLLRACRPAIEGWLDARSVTLLNDYHTDGTVGWATFGCGAGNFGVRGQAKRDPALARSARCSDTLKAPSPLRFAGALQKARVSSILRTALYLRFNSRF